ncbi:MAG: long-chain fatty acid--CoA ligase [Caldilineaceae bacterium]|nr:long-chain fatty acid--CoA ligase [Caldilineaceae bacterium]
MSTYPAWHLHYEPGVARTIEIPDIPVYEVLRNCTRLYPRHIALRLILRYLPLGLRLGSTMTYAELDQASDRFAAALHSLGIQQNDRVAIMLPNIPQQVIAYFGTLKAGAIVVNTNPTYTARELQNQLRDSGAETIITLTGLYKRVQESKNDTSLKRIIVTDLVDSLPIHWRLLATSKVRATGLMADVPDAPHIFNFYKLLRRHPAQAPSISYAPDDVVLFQYTGGTTGVPNAAMLTHRNVVSNLKQIQEWLHEIDHGKEKLLGTLPFFHVYGMTCGLLTAPEMGAELIMTPDPRATELVLQIIDREHVTFYPGVPAMYSAIINHPLVKRFNLRSVKACLSGGASLPLEVARSFEEITGGHLVEGYGLSECSPVAAANPLRGERRPGTIGLPISNTNIEIVALEPDSNGDFPQVPQGEEGELVVYGPQVMKGYWNNPEATAKALNRRGGLHTGDIAKMDEDGFLYIVDRKKDLIIASGYNVVPREVEEVLFMYPKVMDATVIGVPNPRRGEVVKAYIVLKPGEEATVDEIRTFCKQYLALYKVPKSVEFRKEIPKSQVGKVLRRLLVAEEVAKQQARQEKIAARRLAARG